MSSARTPFVLSRDRWLTPALARQSRKTGSPVVSTIVCSVIYAFFALGNLVDLVVLDVFLINILLLMNLVALIVLRIKQPNLVRPTKLPWGRCGIALFGVPLVASVFYLMYVQWLDYGLIAFAILAATLGLSVLVLRCAVVPAPAPGIRSRCERRADHCRTAQLNPPHLEGERNGTP